MLLLLSTPAVVGMVGCNCHHRWIVAAIVVVVDIACHGEVLVLVVAVVTCLGTLQKFGHSVITSASLRAMSANYLCPFSILNPTTASTDRHHPNIDEGQW